MKIRDSFSKLDGSGEVFTAESGGIDILSDDGRTIFSISIKDNVLRLDAGMVCKIDDLVYEDRFSIKPIAANCIEISKNKWNRD